MARIQGWPHFRGPDSTVLILELFLLIIIANEWSSAEFGVDRL